MCGTRCVCAGAILLLLSTRRDTTIGLLSSNNQATESYSPLSLLLPLSFIIGFILIQRDIVFKGQLSWSLSPRSMAAPSWNACDSTLTHTLAPVFNDMKQFHALTFLWEIEASATLISPTCRLLDDSLLKGVRERWQRCLWRWLFTELASPATVACVRTPRPGSTRGEKK